VWATLPRASLAQRDRILLLGDTLLTAVDEIERLRESEEMTGIALDSLERERDRLRAEVERLRALLAEERE